MPKVSVNILTKNRTELLRKALASVARQSFKDFEVEAISDGSINQAQEQTLDKELQEAGMAINFIYHHKSLGITQSRQEALEKSRGEYIAVLDDDDEWIDADKLKKQVEYLDARPDVVLVGGGIKSGYEKFRPESDSQIRNTILFRNNFFTSTVMFRRQAAIDAGGFVKDANDFAEDYDLWLRLGKTGKMYNFQELFTAYREPSYNKERFKAFLAKQLRLIKARKGDYPYYWLALPVLQTRLLF
jgi:glycosyltransferase EpsE